MCVNTYINCMTQVFDKNFKNSDLKIDKTFSLM